MCELNTNKLFKSNQTKIYFFKTYENALIVILNFFFKYAWILNIIHEKIQKTYLKKQKKW